MTRDAKAKRKRVLVTGGSGTLGYNILRQLAATGRFNIIAPLRSRHTLLQDFGDTVQFVDHELSDAIHTAQIFERANPDVIIHCAASGLRPPKGSWFDLMHFNVESTMRLFQMNCRFDHHSHFIYISTGLVYREQGRPLRETDPIETLHPYGASKAAGDSMLQAAAAEFKRRLTILRPFAFTGKHDGGERLFPRILTAAAEGKVLPMTQGDQIRDFCSVDDIARAVMMVTEREEAPLIEKFNLGSGKSLPLKDLVRDVCIQLNLDVKFDLGAVKMHPYEPMHSVADISHAKEILGWEPQVSLARAVWELARESHPEMKLTEPNSPNV
ncbi:NAD-dependent epimerase/dehydratase family protein [Terriglobus saanensis]|uniref:NAD-dependent epimerase/dehydratase n=1 Tax=Terriglobus saanensis (strain ATCC BAA-1853 / DSM 23119 / SP1PR4) TaxID=401053 RepID=E8V5R8_TERSS|nr:NAD(P)-dependent oxidoreductase [Terriglobus saanensis]ADV82677.1 NAD-dependent epimerase/dehydratase [Terriglobus saanensis SP1PR4]